VSHDRRPTFLYAVLDHQIGALPVEEGGRLVGIVTETDLLRAFIRLEAPV
jgi:CBS domain-containing protein